MIGIARQAAARRDSARPQMAHSSRGRSVCTANVRAPTTWVPQVVQMGGSRCLRWITSWLSEMQEPDLLVQLGHGRARIECMKLIGVHHVAINVEDVDAAVEFYTKKLGMTLRTDRPDFGVPGAWLDAGHQQIHLLQVPVPEPRGQHFALHVADLDAVVAELRDGGVTVSDPNPVGTGRQAFTADPAGNQIELHQPG